MKFLLACVGSLICAGCNTLENRRDLYSPDTYFYRQQPAVATVSQTTTTTTTTSVPEFRPHADQD